MARKGRGSKIWLTTLLVVLVSLGGAGLALRGSWKTDPKIDATKLVTIDKGDLAKSVVATGKIQPRSKVEVKSKASGIVKKLLVDYGDWVRAGQVLAELDKEELNARLREAQALLQAAKASEDSAEASLERNKVEA